MRIAVIGTGSIGARYCQWIVEAGCQVIVVDSDPAVAAAVAQNTSGLSADLQGLAALLPQAVIVAAPPKAHRSIVETTLAAGLPTLVEKPLAADVGDARAMLTAASASMAPLYVVCNMRFHPGPAAIATNLHRIGQPLFARAHFGHRLSQMRSNRDARTLYAACGEEGGGAILDCIHEIDLQQHLFGLGVLETASVATLGGEMSGAEDYAELVLRFPSGVRSALHLDLLQRCKRRGWEIAGTNGTLVWNSEGRTPEKCSVRLMAQSETEVLFSSDSLDGSICYRSMLACFIASVAHCRRATDLQTPEQAFRALEIALAARQSIMRCCH